MSTNFYVRGYRGDMDPEYHIGKSTSRHFIWAMAPQRLAEIRRIRRPKCSLCERALEKPTAIIEDETGAIYTARQFEELLRGTEQDEHSVGQWFS